MKVKNVVAGAVILGTVGLMPVQAGAWEEVGFSEFSDTWNPFEEETGWEYDEGGETDTQPETESMPESETQAEIETETESQKRQIYITEISVASSDGTKVYDGSRNVPLKVRVSGLPAGVRLEIVGKTKKADVGTWKVECDFLLYGEGGERYELNTDLVKDQIQKLQVEILPRPLTVWIGDARKEYYSECEMENLDFFMGDMIQVKGFVTDASGNELIPPDFCYPELTLDADVIQKDSPMYSYNKEVIYHNAVILKRKSNGEYTGNPSKNYYFSEETVYPGDVYLVEKSVTNNRNFEVTGENPEAFWKDTDGTLWVRKGEQLKVNLLEDCGFSEGIVEEETYGSGKVTLLKRSEKGEILAVSSPAEVTWKVDETAPEGMWEIDGKTENVGDVFYSNQAVTVRLLGESDQGSGLKTTEIIVSRKNQEENENRLADSVSWINTKEQVITEEGIWKIKARLIDQVGNERILEGPEIVIDKKKPEIAISGIVNGSANGGIVAPRIICSDTNYKEGSLKISLEGGMTGKRNLQQKIQENAKGAEVETEDLPRKKEWDDRYELTVGAQDLAGNVSQEKIVFSVNRFGSVYELEEQTKERLKQFYLKESPEVIIKEINIDEITASHIVVLHDGEVKELTREVDYEVEKGGTSWAWKEYRYMIHPNTFEKEGMYTVIISSQDGANNSSDNRMKEQKIEFAVDKTMPDIMVSGVKDGEIYDGEKGKSVHIQCRDNLALEEICVYLNGKLMMQNLEQEQEISLEQAQQWQKIQIIARDKAGNENVAEEISFWYGKRQSVTKNSMQKPQKETDAPKEAEEVKKKKLDIFWLFPSICVLIYVLFRHGN
ncbi:MAG: hypothetical protein ACI4EI_00095, partial [Muricoprocola sp.]